MSANFQLAQLTYQNRNAIHNKYKIIKEVDKGGKKGHCFIILNIKMLNNIISNYKKMKNFKHTKHKPTATDIPINK